MIDLAGNPIVNAQLDVWGTNANGLYENIDPSQPDYNLRGRFHTDSDGRYDLWTVKPVSYPIPNDGPVGEFLAATKRDHMRPAHFHVIASADGWRTIVTELYTDDDPYLESDAVFGVKPSLIVHYDRVTNVEQMKTSRSSGPFWDLQHDFVLVPGESSSIAFTTARESAV